MKILWLVSWYPNRKDRFDGDFIQRHARAAATCHEIYVIFVTDIEMEKKMDEELTYAMGLTEQIIYFKKKKGFAARLRKQLAWKNIYIDAVKKYVAKNGLPDIVHVHVPWKAGLIALWIKNKFGRSFIITEHWGYYNREVENNFFSYPVLVQKLVRKIYNEALAVCTVSKFLAMDIEKVTGRKTDFIIPNVVDTTLFSYKNEKYSKFTFIHVSNMVYWKQVEKILEAFIRVKNKKEDNVQMILIGNRDCHYVDIARKYGCLNKSVFFKGEVPYWEVAMEMNKAHCHVLFGNFETFSCVTAESLCSGVPVIIPCAGAVNELVKHKENGLVVSKNDTHGLFVAMLEMVERYDTFNPVSISEQASKEFSYSSVAQKFDELYQQQKKWSTFM